MKKFENDYHTVDLAFDSEYTIKQIKAKITLKLTWLQISVFKWS